MKKLLYLIVLLIATTANAQVPQLMLNIDGATPNPLSDKTGIHNVNNNNGVYDDNGTIVFPASSDAYLYIDSIGNRIDLNKNWTFECDLKVNDSTDQVAIIDFRSTSTTGNLYFYYNIYGHGVHFSDRAINGNTDALIADSTLLPQNVWVALKLEFMNDTLRLFRDGVLMKDTVITATLSETAKTTIGYSEDRRIAHDTFYMDNIKFYAIDTTTGIANVQMKKVQFYPNPAINELTILSTEQLHSVDVFDLQGKKVMSNVLKNNKLDVAALQPGVYYLRAYGDKQELLHGTFVKE